MIQPPVIVRRQRLLLLAAVLITVVASANAAITFNGAKCGTKLCRVDEFCSKYDSQCEKCSTVCDDSTHNFDKELCTKECQDYLHDMRYTRHGGNSAELKHLQKQMNIVLILLIIILLILAVHTSIRLAKWCRGRGIITGLLRKMKLKKPSKNGVVGKVPIEELTRANPNTQSPKVQLRIVADRNQNQANRESTVFSVGAASTIQTVSTPISTRYPAEDSTLSYSYDNAGLAVTPTIPDRPRVEF